MRPVATNLEKFAVTDVPAQAGSIPASSNPDRVWLVTGCSSGIGRALCERVLASGERVVCTARRVETLSDLVDRYPDRAIALPLDVTDAASVRNAVEQAIARAGKIDILVNNAGFGVIGAIEEIDEADVRRLFDTNFFGVLAVTKAVLPHMRARGFGHILNMSSALALFPRGGYGIYAASKFALEGLSESLAQEVAPFGIKVTILAPGSLRTDFRGPSMVQATPMPPYDETLAQFRRDIVEGDGKQPGDPVRGAAAIMAVVNAAEPPLRFAMGRQSVNGARTKLAAAGRTLEQWQDLSLTTDFD
jgi:NAD(P)-dependent dehydrogenase (short-subunit alcohol dehydrogenase family)